jgi:hypothetical protein
MRRRAVRLPALGAALTLLCAPFLLVADPWTGRVVPLARFPAVTLILLVVLAAAALVGARLGRMGRGSLAFLLVLAAVLQLAGAFVQATLDRPLDLYFDLPQVTSLLGLLKQAEGPWLAAAIPAAMALGAIALWAASAWAIGLAEGALAQRRGASLAVLAAAGMAVLGGDSILSFTALDAIADQGARLSHAAAVASGRDHQYDAALASPEPKGDLAALAGRDVFLVFVESYGTVLFDDPRFRDTAAPAFAEFAASLARSGYAVATGRLISPVFGGGSWLAHGTLESGLKLDPFLDRLVVTSGRKTLASALASSGHHAIAVMPGIKKPWPEAAAWGFGETMFAKDLAYNGPAFGWFAIPDQYTFENFAARELAPGHAPIFAEIVLVSSHTPFAPVPPYVHPWQGAASFAGIAPAAAADWSHLEQPYRESVAYDLKVLAGWLDRLAGNGLVIVLGDHQPPGVASGATAPWTVPIHVLSRDPALVAPFVRSGYVEGVLPPAGPGKGMESFLRDFLASFSTAGTS